MAGLKRKMDSSEEGVATTVGTIMALLIFLSILSLITQQYVPVWMEDNEAYHMDEVKGQFADLKSGIDSMVINERTDYPLYSSINLGTAGIPLFAGSSPGRLTFSPRWGGEEKGMSLNFTDGDELVSFSDSTGNISYHAINREFEDQSLIYEQGGIILEQSDGEIMRAKPHFSIEEIDDGESEVSITMIHLTGSSRDVAGTSRVGITTELVSTFSHTYFDIGHMFSLEDPDEYDLDGDTIGDNLVEAFEDEGYEIDEDAGLSQENDEWIISEDGDEKYVIEERDGYLHISSIFNWNFTTSYPELWVNYFNEETDALAQSNGNMVNITMPTDEDGNYKINELDIRRVRVEIEIGS